MNVYGQLTLLLLFMLSPILIPGVVHVIGTITDALEHRAHRRRAD